MSEHDAIAKKLVDDVRKRCDDLLTLTDEWTDLEATIAAALRAEREKLEKFAAALKSLKKYEPLVYDERDDHGVLSYAEMDETPSGEWVRYSDIEGAMK